MSIFQGSRPSQRINAFLHQLLFIILISSFSARYACAQGTEPEPSGGVTTPTPQPTPSTTPTSPFIKVNDCSALPDATTSVNAQANYDVCLQYFDSANNDRVSIIPASYSHLSSSDINESLTDHQRTLYILEGYGESNQQITRTIDANFKMPASSSFIGNRSEKGYRPVIKHSPDHESFGGVIALEDGASTYRFINLEVISRKEGSDTIISSTELNGLDLEEAGTVIINNTKIVVDANGHYWNASAIEVSCSEDSPTPSVDLIDSEIELIFPAASRSNTAQSGEAVYIHNSCDSSGKTVSMKVQNTTVILDSPSVPSPTPAANSQTVYSGRFFYIKTDLDQTNDAESSTILHLLDGSNCNRILSNTGVDISATHSGFVGANNFSGDSTVNNRIVGILGFDNGFGWGWVDSGNGVYTTGTKTWDEWNMGEGIDVSCQIPTTSVSSVAPSTMMMPHSTQGNTFTTPGWETTSSSLGTSPAEMAYSTTASFNTSVTYSAPGAAMDEDSSNGSGSSSGGVVPGVVATVGTITLGAAVLYTTAFGVCYAKKTPSACRPIIYMTAHLVTVLPPFAQIINSFGSPMSSGTFKSNDQLANAGSTNSDAFIHSNPAYTDGTPTTD